MNSKAIIMMGMVLGSTVGGFIPAIWGASFLSFSSILFSTLGGIAGIWLAFRLIR